jgi:transposase
LIFSFGGAKKSAWGNDRLLRGTSYAFAHGVQHRALRRRRLRQTATRPGRKQPGESALDGDFSKAYADSGRPSIAPERLLRALLLQAFYTIRSERQLMEQLDYNLLYRWFVGLGVDEPVWVPTVFTKNRDRLLEADVARKFLAELMEHKELRKLLSDEHFSVDGTQIVTWASMKSFKANDGSGDPPGPGRNGERDFHDEKPSNATPASSTDPERSSIAKDVARKPNSVS